jgi:hypothetical protein
MICPVLHREAGSRSKTIQRAEDHGWWQTVRREEPTRASAAPRRRKARQQALTRGDGQ